MNRTVALVALVASVVLVAGCATTPPAASPSQPSPAQTAAQAVETGETAPAAVFGGECASVLTDEQLATVFGGEARSLTYELAYRPDGVLVQQFGGVRCLWRGGDENAAFDYYLDAAALPASALDGASISSKPCEVLAGFEVRCEVAVEAHGVLFSTLLGLPEETTLDDADGFAAQLAEAFESNASTQDDYLAPIQAGDAWPLDFSCADLAIDVPELLGNDNLDLTPDLFETHESPVERVLWGDRQALGCSWVDNSGQGSTVQVVALGGAAWAAEPFSADYPVDGVDSVTVSDEAGLRTFNVVDGPNWLQLSASSVNDEQVAALIHALVDALDGAN